MMSLLLNFGIIYAQTYNQHFIQSSKLTSPLKMKKRNSNNSNYEHCCVCFPADDQVASIADSLLEQILATLSQYKKDASDQHCSKLEPLDFSKLLKMIFNKRFKNLKATNLCKHTQMKKNFVLKIGCTEKQLDKVSSLISWRIAKFQYHTDVIIAQSKSFLRHFTQNQERKESSQNTSNRKKSSQNSLFEVKQEQQERQHLISSVNEPNNKMEGFNFLPKTQETLYDPFPMMWQLWPTHMMMPNSQMMGNKNMEQQQKDRGNSTEHKWGQF